MMGQRVRRFGICEHELGGAQSFLSGLMVDCATSSQRLLLCGHWVDQPAWRLKAALNTGRTNQPAWRLTRQHSTQAAHNNPVLAHHRACVHGPWNPQPRTRDHIRLQRAQRHQWRGAEGAQRLHKGRGVWPAAVIGKLAVVQIPFEEEQGGGGEGGVQIGRQLCAGGG